LKAYGQALRLKQDDKNATIGYLRTAMACDRNEARSAMDRAMTAFPDDRDIIVLDAGMLMEEREFVKAAAMLEKVRRAGRDGREILDKLIICYEASGDSEKVIETCNTVLAKDPYCLNAALSCARALAARGRYEERRKVLLRCFKGNPYSRELIQCLMN